MVHVYITYSFTYTHVVCSTISSGLDAVAAVILEDFVRPMRCKAITPARATFLSKVFGTRASRKTNRSCFYQYVVRGDDHGQYDKCS
ncbi:hypothetical protein DPMN_120750 [Dreissena polymorpha]|uniref:Uncharacterized protein n=1 Tax=Dreissena polymorpha TaxID=45954 RepID=A0A9D4JNU5_DREPO|nr:hypothetical protein DPMN_120750 [Dreissena polymorpha]